MMSSRVLVLLPGLDGTGILFEQLQQALAGQFDLGIVRYPPDPGLGYPELEAVARKSLPRNRDFILLGESFSGPIAMRIAADPPSGFRGLILAVTFARNPYPVFARLRSLLPAGSTRLIPERWRLPLILGHERPPEIFAQIQRTHALVGDAVIKKRVQEVLSVDATDALRRIAVPILSIRAGRDRLVPSSAGRYIERHARNVETVFLDAPHMLLQTRAPQAAAVINAFADRVSADR